MFESIRNFFRARESAVPDTSVALRGVVEQQGLMLDVYQERLAELELALEDVGWVRLLAQREQDLSREGLRTIARLARMFRLWHPLVKRAVETQRFYVFAQGVSVAAKHPELNRVLQSFWDDEKNKAELTGHQARGLKEEELQVEANLFFVFFTNRLSGRVRVRSIPCAEIDEVLASPEDAKEPWYYRRSWTEQKLDLESGVVQGQARVTYHPDWRYQPKVRPKTIGGRPVAWDSPVYHVRSGASHGIAVSELYASIDWARSYREFLEDWVTLSRAYSRWAHKLTTPGGAKGVAAAKTKLNTTLGAASGSGAETNPPAIAGSVWIGSKGGADLEPIRIGGANVSAEDGRRLLLMVSAATGWPETFFGDVSVGTLATATSLDRPTELRIRDRQSLWSDVYRDTLLYVFLQAAKASDGPLSGLADVVRDPDDGTESILMLPDDEHEKPWRPELDIDWPPVIQRDVEKSVGAIVSAATLDGKSPAGTIEIRELVRMLLVALGEDDVDELIKRMFPDGQAQAMPAGEEAPAAEAMMTEAVRELRAGLLTLVEKWGSGHVEVA